jgi:hypothetical protein
MKCDEIIGGERKSSGEEEVGRRGGDTAKRGTQKTARKM